MPAGRRRRRSNDLITAINAANGGNTLDVTAKLSGGASGDLVLTGTNGPPRLRSRRPAQTPLHLACRPERTRPQPVNLLTQGAVAQGDTMTITVGNGAPQTITFGTNTGAGQVATLAQLQAAIGGTERRDRNRQHRQRQYQTDVEQPNCRSTAPRLRCCRNLASHNDAAYPANDTVIANDETTFTNKSVDGGSITAYDTEGNPVNVQFRWAETSAGSWQLFYQSNSNATGTQAAWQNVGTVFNFNSSGELTPPISSVTLQNLTVNGDNLGNVAAQFRHQRSHPVRKYQRHDAGEPVAAEWVRRRPTRIGRGR